MAPEDELLFTYVCRQKNVVYGTITSRDAEKGKATATQQRGTTQLAQNNHFSKTIGRLGWDPNPQPSALQATLLPTKLPTKAAQLAGPNPVYKITKHFNLINW